MSSYHPDKACSICQHIESHFDLKTHVCAKFEESRSILCLVIIRTRFGVCQYVDKSL